MSSMVLSRRGGLRRNNSDVEEEEPSREVNTRAWLAASFIPFFAYIVADVLCILYLPLPSFGGGDTPTDYWGLFGWILHFVGLLVYVCTKLILCLRHSPFSSAVLLGYQLTLTIMTVSSVLFSQNRVASEMVRPFNNNPTTAVQMQWIATLFMYAYFTVMVYHAPYNGAGHELHDPNGAGGAGGGGGAAPTTIKIEQLINAMGASTRKLNTNTNTNPPPSGLGAGTLPSTAVAPFNTTTGSNGIANTTNQSSPSENGGGGGSSYPLPAPHRQSHSRNGSAVGMSNLPARGTSGSRTGHHKRTPSQNANRRTINSSGGGGGGGGTASGGGGSNSALDPIASGIGPGAFGFSGGVNTTGMNQTNGGLGSMRNNNPNRRSISRTNPIVLPNNNFTSPQPYHPQPQPHHPQHQHQHQHQHQPMPSSGDSSAQASPQPNAALHFSNTGGGSAGGAGMPVLSDADTFGPPPLPPQDDVLGTSGGAENIGSLA